MMRNMVKSIPEYWNGLETPKKRDLAGGVITVGSLATGIGSPFVPIAGVVYFSVRYRGNFRRLYENVRDKIEDLVDKQI